MIQIDVNLMVNSKWILRFGELGLKSKTVRGSFQRALLNNMLEQARLAKVELIVDKQRSQFHVYSNSDKDAVENLLCHVLGIVAIDRVEKLDCDYSSKSIAKSVLDNSPNFGTKRTFGVRVKRMYKFGDISSKDYEIEIGSEMIALDNNLSVNLSSPDEWIRIIVDSNGVSRIVDRIETTAGLPTGVQGDVIANLVDEKTMLESFLVMRRGVRLIPVLDSKEIYIEKLARYDPFIGQRTMERDRHKFSPKRPAWGVIGLSIEDAEPFIGQRDDAVKTTPLSTLSPLDGWDDNEINALSLHFENPRIHSINLNVTNWINNH